MGDTYTQVKDITVNITTAVGAGSVGLGNPLVIEGTQQLSQWCREVSISQCN